MLTSGGLIALGAVLGAVLGGFITNWLGDKRDQRKYAHEQAMAEQAQRHERTMALEARRQERLEQAYIELLRYLSHYADWAKSAQRLLGKPQAAPDPPPREELNRVEALVEAYGSPEVRQLLREWREHAAKLQYDDEGLPTFDLHDDADADDEAWAQDMKVTSDHRKATLKGDQAIRERIRQELAGEA